MTPASIIVVGAEGSGTTLLWNCVARHPQLQGMTARNAPEQDAPLPAEGVILHLSLPTLRPMRWYGGWAVARGVRVIVLRRSPLHTVFSAYRRFYSAPRPAWRNYLRAVALEASWIARHEPLCLAYEDLVHNTAPVLRRVYAFVGVDPDFPPPIAVSDQNDERWRRDPRFARFVQRTFAIDRGSTPALDEDAPPVRAPARSPTKQQSFGYNSSQTNQIQQNCYPVRAPARSPMKRRSFGYNSSPTHQIRQNCYAESLDFSSHGTRIAIEDASGSGVVEALRAALPPDLEPAGDGTAGAHYTVERRTAKNGAIAYRVLAGGEVRLRTRHKGHVVDWLRKEIEEIVAESSRTSLFVHAGVVGWRGHAILIPGRTMSGKSRLVTELVRCGATYYSDEFAVLDGEGRVLPYARQTVLRDPDVEVDLGSRDASEALPVGLIVSTSYRAGAAWQPRELRGVRAVVPIIDNTVLARQESRLLLQLSAKIAPRAVTLHGPRPEAAEVAPRLLAYLDSVLDSNAAGQPARGPASLVARAEAVVAASGGAPDEILPPRYARIDGLFPEEEHARLLDYALRRQADFTTSSVIDPSGAFKVDEQFRRSATLYDLEGIRDLVEARLRPLLPHVRRELEMPWFPLGRIEMQMSAHRGGDFFGRHNDDGDSAVAARRLTCVYYFHGRPKRFTGGDLKLYERVVRGGRVEAGEGHVVVEPEDNTAIFFTSSTPHEVCAVSQGSADFADSRFSLTTWFWLGTPPGCLEGLAEPPPAAVAETPR